MGLVRAVVVDPRAAGGFVIEEVEAPRPSRSEAVVQVAATSLNPGELRVATRAERGWRPGRDLAGTVIAQAADGSGPATGARVCAMRGTEGSWAEQVAVAADALAELPDDVSFQQAATLPTAGLTALFALARGGLAASMRVLITGSSGGIGQFAHRLATLSGAVVVGSVRNEDHVTAVREAGADHVAVGGISAAPAFGPFDLIVDSLGGDALAAAMTSLTPGGTCVNLGSSAGDHSTVDIGAFMRTGRATLYGMRLGAELRGRAGGTELSGLTRLVGRGLLTPRIAVETSWNEIGRVADDLLQRQFIGKAVVHIAP